MGAERASQLSDRSLDRHREAGASRKTVMVALGANAVIGIRYDATEIVKGATEVICYGTAVLAEPM